MTPVNHALEVAIGALQAAVVFGGYMLLVAICVVAVRIYSAWADSRRRRRT